MSHRVDNDETASAAGADGLCRESPILRLSSPEDATIKVSTCHQRGTPGSLPETAGRMEVDGSRVLAGREAGGGSRQTGERHINYHT